jgi:hypothetical protein
MEEELRKPQINELEEKINSLEKRIETLEKINKRKRTMTIVSGILVGIVFIILICIYAYYFKTYLTELNSIWQ